ncbi:hypothetical protein Sjap_014414 [Stephania japonica]|uniref:Uncharacterized protein n=1 Tax=Stephania japonica TaxID=461633 RepID=A0AAP0IHI8_9MAGN
MDNLTMRNAFLAIEDATGVGTDVIEIDAIQRFLALLGTYELLLVARTVRQADLELPPAFTS